ncbi:MAG: hypothetical protein J0H00_06945 [Burkholderiales bacterium]|nr:hypothetical protein [Burkholderiales bacterium]
MKDFAGKVAVITGAGSGFGRELARLRDVLGQRNPSDPFTYKPEVAHRVG